MTTPYQMAINNVAMAIQKQKPQEGEEETLHEFDCLQCGHRTLPEIDCPHCGHRNRLYDREPVMNAFNASIILGAAFCKDPNEVIGDILAATMPSIKKPAKAKTVINETRLSQALGTMKDATQQGYTEEEVFQKVTYLHGLNKAETSLVQDAYRRLVEDR